MSIKVAVNCLYLLHSTNSGLGKHFEDILSGMLQLECSDQLYLIMDDSFYNEYFKGSVYGELVNRNQMISVITCSVNPIVKFVAEHIVKTKGLFQQLYLNQVVLRRLLKKYDMDVGFFPFNQSVNLVKSRVPLVTVIHDLCYKNFPGNSKNYLIRLYLFYVDLKHRAMLKHSSLIVAISDYVKSDILKHFPKVNAEKIVVIPNAMLIEEGTAALGDIDKPYLLSVGTHDVHKNQITLLKAFSQISGRIPHKLVMLGAERENTRGIINYINDNNLCNRVLLLSDIGDAERNWLYTNTDLYISPSLHEGFGRTPIEAAMLGAMVLTSRETSLPEVTLDLLNYYEPATDENALAEKILYLLANPTPEEERKAIAKNYKETYDPVRIAVMYNDAFRKAISSSGSK